MRVNWKEIVRGFLWSMVGLWVAWHVLVLHDLQRAFLGAS